LMTGCARRLESERRVERGPWDGDRVIGPRVRHNTAAGFAARLGLLPRRHVARGAAAACRRRGMVRVRRNVCLAGVTRQALPVVEAADEQLAGNRAVALRMRVVARGACHATGEVASAVE